MTRKQNSRYILLGAVLAGFGILSNVSVLVVFGHYRPAENLEFFVLQNLIVGVIFAGLTMFMMLGVMPRILKAKYPMGAPQGKFGETSFINFFKSYGLWIID